MTGNSVGLGVLGTLVGLGVTVTFPVGDGGCVARVGGEGAVQIGAVGISRYIQMRKTKHR